MVATEERLTTQHRGQGIETLTRQVLEASSQMLQLSRPLDPMVHQTLLRVYFSYFANWCLWCDEAAFVAGLRQVPSSVPLSYQALALTFFYPERAQKRLKPFDRRITRRSSTARSWQ